MLECAMAELLIVGQALPTDLFAKYPQASFVSVEIAVEQLFLKQWDIVFIDIAVPGQEALQLLEMLKYSGAELVFCHELNDPQVTEALWAGGRFFISRTTAQTELSGLIARIMQRRQALAEHTLPQQSGIPLADIIESLPDLILHKIQAYAVDAEPVLLIGPPGTEWQYIAYTLGQSAHRQRAFSVHYCHSPKDLLDVSFLYAAYQGTIIIADIAYFTVDMQLQLKSLLEHPPVPLFICTYSSKSLRAEVAAGRFDENLYRLISRREIALPLLRDRSDFLQVIQRVVTAVNKRYGLSVGLSDEALAALLAYSWPGNLQELLGVLSMAMRLAEGKVLWEALPAKIKKAYIR